MDTTEAETKTVDAMRMRELRVLIVDDDVVLASVLAKMLERRGCVVETLSLIHI